MKVTDSLWFCAGHGNLGIVQVEDEYDGRKYYIGCCTGVSEEADMEYIAKWGSSFPRQAGDVLFGVE